MPMTFKYTGKRLPVVAGGVRTSSAIVCDALVAAGDNTVAGIAQSKALAAGATLWIEVAGVHNLPVPAGLAAGTLLYAPGESGSGAGTGPTPGDAIVLTDSSTHNTLFGKMMSTADASNLADVQILDIRY